MLSKVILIHANCKNPTAQGDFSFAGNIAKDLVREIEASSVHDTDVILVSSLDGITRFEKLYGAAINHRLNIEGTDIGLAALETFDAVNNNVIAFIEANRCSYPAENILKRVLSPETKFIFLGNANQHSYTDLFTQTLYRMQLKLDQPGLYVLFNDEDILIGSAGLGPDRFGIPAITKSSALPLLTPSESSIVPTTNYGFMYIALINGAKDYQLIAQYIKLSGHDEFILVGNFADKKDEIRAAFISDTTLVTSQKDLPPIQYYNSLSNKVMRKMVSKTTGSLVLSTGVTSTLEAMRDEKLPYYQDLSNNANFIAAYLIAVKSIISSDTSLIGMMPQFVIELSSLLFAKKPLNKIDMKRTDELLKMPSVSSRLITTNQLIIDQASGKIASKLLGFLHGTRHTKDQVQLAMVCPSLRKSGEIGSPVSDQALRRAAAYGRLFELKVLIKSMPTAELSKKDSTYERSALHWAAHTRNYACANALIKAGAPLDDQDKEGQTPLHIAIINGDKPLIEQLLSAGASVSIQNKDNKNAQDCAHDEGVILLINHSKSGVHY